MDLLDGQSAGVVPLPHERRTDIRVRFDKVEGCFRPHLHRGPDSREDRLHPLRGEGKGHSRIVDVEPPDLRSFPYQADERDPDLGVPGPEIDHGRIRHRFHERNILHVDAESEREPDPHVADRDPRVDGLFHLRHDKGYEAVARQHGPENQARRQHGHNRRGENNKSCFPSVFHPCHPAFVKHRLNLTQRGCIFNGISAKRRARRGGLRGDRRPLLAAAPPGGDG